MSNQIFWMALQDKRSVLPFPLLERIDREFDNIEDLWYANEKELRKIGFTPAQANQFFIYANSVRLTKYEEIIESMKTTKTRIISYFAEEYPPRLKITASRTWSPPLILYLRGNLPNIENCVGIVGTRNASFNARFHARQFAIDLAKAGNTIVSGLAYGIDYEAHMGALSVKNAKTISVLASMEPIYPKEHTELSNQIVRNGCILSETYPGRIRKYSFVERNRIISGISDYIIAVEANPTGGTVRQVEIAISQNIPVFTLTPDKNVNKEKQRGFKKIVSLGAKPIKNLDDIQDIARAALIH